MRTCVDGDGASRTKESAIARVESKEAENEKQSQRGLNGAPLNPTGTWQARTALPGYSKPLQPKV